MTQQSVVRRPCLSLCSHNCTRWLWVKQLVAMLAVLR